MMKGTQNIVLLIAVLLVGMACQQNNKEIIAEKIQYDINIKSPDPEYDWWIQNLPGPQREYFVDMIIDGAISGKYKAYDYFYSPLTLNEVASIMSDTTYFTLYDEDPPYAERDTMVIYTILKEDIQRIRFLEEWHVDPTNLSTEKKVLGIAPIAKRIDVTGTERWQPLFWIFVDEKFIEELDKQQDKIQLK